MRNIKDITDLGKFTRFLKLCAARTGQLLNKSSLANDCGISVPTVDSWLSILESSYIIFLLKPDHKNYYCCPLNVSEQRDIHPQCCCNGIADDFSEGKPLS